MAFVYILQEKHSGKYYTESCVDLQKRITRHQQGTASRTTGKGTWALLMYRPCVSIQEVRTIKKLIKSYKGGNAFKKIIHGELAEWSKAPHC